MKKKSHPISHKNGQSGVAAVITAICIAVFLGIAAIAIDIGYMMVTRNELQNIGDAAALAGARRLGTIYVGDGYGELGLSALEQQNYVCDSTDIAKIKLAAKNVALQNWAGGKENITINDSDILIGTWILETFTPTTNHPNAVQVTARRDDNANGPISTFFAKIFNIDLVPVRASAIAALTSRSTSPPGGLPIPIALSTCWFLDPNFCGEDIVFYPTKDSQAGWHCYEDWPCASAKINQILNDLIIDPNLSTEQETVVGETEFVFTGGDLGQSAFGDMEVLFDNCRVLNDGKIDMDQDTNTWTTSVAVYDPAKDCDGTYNPSGNLVILGFATVILRGVESPSDPNAQRIVAYIECGLSASGRGSGGYFGTLGSVPGLVE
ncbi:MAG: pilus assembly protein TadG-related protein [bacterium]